MNAFQNIVLIGAGNVAANLGIALSKSGIKFFQVYSRTVESAVRLAEKLRCDPVTQLSKISKNADLYIIALADDIVAEAAGKLNLENKMVVHTSGTVSMDVLMKTSSNFGVLYPLQTFSKHREIDFSDVPLCIEASSADNLQKLKNFAKSISNNVKEMGSEQRKVLHLAAVFACNFPNFMYAVADEILKDNKLGFELLRPLILETAMKVQQMKPTEAQTGPAFRRDSKTIGKHIEMLKKYPEWQRIYEIMSKGIQEMD